MGTRVVSTKDLLEQRDALLTDLAAAYAREDALKRERDAAIAERDMHMTARIAAENAARDNLKLVEELRAEVNALRAAGP